MAASSSLRTKRHAARSMEADAVGSKANSARARIDWADLYMSGDDDCGRMLRLTIEGLGVSVSRRRGGFSQPVGGKGARRRGR